MTASADSPRSAGKRLVVRPPVKVQVLALFFRRLATLLQAGMALHPALEFLAASEDDPVFAEIIDHIARRVAGGWSLSHCFSAPEFGRIFSDVTVGLISLGEETGGLIESISRLADLMEHQSKLGQSLISALTYPCALFCFIVLVSLLFIFVLGPGDTGIFALVGGTPPWPSRWLMAASAVLHNPFKVITLFLPFILLAWIFRTRMASSPSFRMAVHGVLLELPIVGPVLRKIDTARMLYVLAAATAVGVPMTRALSLSLSVCQNVFLRERCRQAHVLFLDGTDLVVSLERFGVFPKMVTCMIHSGLEAGKLDSLLSKISLDFEEEVISSLNNAVRLIEPVMLGFAGVLAGFLGLATLLPILEVVNHL